MKSVHPNVIAPGNVNVHTLHQQNTNTNKNNNKFDVLPDQLLYTEMEINLLEEAKGKNQIITIICTLQSLILEVLT